MSIVTDALESSISPSTEYFNPIRTYMPIDQYTPSGQLSMYPSSLLTEDNLVRLDRCAIWFDSQNFSTFPLQDAIEGVQRCLGDDLLAELQLGISLPLYNISHKESLSMVIESGNPFQQLVVPTGFRRAYSGVRIDALYRKTSHDPALLSCFVNSLYNLAYLNSRMSHLEYNWLFAQLLARAQEPCEASLEGACLCLVPDLYRRSMDYNPYRDAAKSLAVLEHPRDVHLTETYNQLTYYLDTHCSTYSGSTHVNKLALFVFTLVAPKTMRSEDCPSPRTTMPVQYLTDYGTTHTQSVTKLLPGSCFALRLGSTEFGIPALSAVSQYGTHVLLFPATRECYVFLCKLYGIKPCDGITPLIGTSEMLWSTLFSPHIFIQVLRQEGITNFDSTRCAQYIFNDTHSLTKYIPGMEYSDAPQYRVNEFEVPSNGL